MIRPTYLDLATDEWNALKAELLDTYCEVFTTGDTEHETRYYSPEFILVVIRYHNLDLRLEAPAAPDDVTTILRENDILKSLINDIQDETSEILQKLTYLPSGVYHAELDAIREEVYGVPKEIYSEKT